MEEQRNKVEFKGGLLKANGLKLSEVNNGVYATIIDDSGATLIFLPKMDEKTFRFKAGERSLRLGSTFGNRVIPDTGISLNLNLFVRLADANNDTTFTTYLKSLFSNVKGVAGGPGKTITAVQASKLTDNKLKLLLDAGYTLLD